MAARESPVLILGAGINGAALARELVRRAMPVHVVDVADLSSGTTAYSSRLIHGGLRYLEFGEWGLVRESLADRARLLAEFPHLVRPLRFYVPLATRWSGAGQALRRFLGFKERTGSRSVPRGAWVVRAGLWVYDRLAGSGWPTAQLQPVGQPDHPLVNASRFRWLCSYHDAQVVYAERLVIELLNQARSFARDQGIEFQVHSYRCATRRGDVVELTDGAGTAGTVLRPTAIVNATGAWLDETLARLEVPSPALVGGTSGSHLLTFHHDLRRMLGDRAIYAEAADGRPVFILPFGSATLVGTTDIPFRGDPRTAVAGEDELRYLLAAVNEVFPDSGLARGDVHLHYCGVRPLARQSRSTTAAITRRHFVVQHEAAAIPVFSAVGGKLTTCLSFAEQIAEQVLRRLKRDVPSTRRSGSVDGANASGVGLSPRSESDSAMSPDPSSLQSAARLGFRDAQVRAVWALVGHRAIDLLARAAANAPAGDQPSISHTDLPVAFVTDVIRHEWVTRLEDLVERRLMLLYDQHLSLAGLRDLARLLVAEAKLPPEGIGQSVADCQRRLADHFGKKVLDDPVRARA